MWPGERGGLTVKFNIYSPLELLVKTGNCKMLQAIATHCEAVLLHPSDVSKCCLLNTVRHSQITQFLLELDPRAAITKDADGNYPIQYIHMNWLENPRDPQDYWRSVVLLMREGIRNGIEGFGGFFLPKKRVQKHSHLHNMLAGDSNYAPLSSFIFCSSMQWEAIAQALEGFSFGTPIVQHAITSLSHDFMGYHIASVLECFDCIRIRDIEGRLPLHVALDYGLTWHEGVKDIVDAGQDNPCTERDPQTGLYAFALAAAGDTYKYHTSDDISSSLSPGHCSDLSTIFLLLRHHDAHLHTKIGTTA